MNDITKSLYTDPYHPEIWSYLMNQVASMTWQNFAAIALIYLLGFSMLRLILSRYQSREIIGMSALLGFGGNAFLLFLFMFSIPEQLSFGNFMLSSFLVSVALLLLSIYRFPISKPAGIKEQWSGFLRKLKTSLNMNVLFYLSLLLIIYIGMGTFVTSVYWPVADWDAITTFDFYARAIVNEKTMVTTTVIDQEVNAGVAYPPLTTLGIVFSYLAGFASPKFLFSWMYLSFLLTFYCFTRKFVNSTSAIFFTLLVIFTPQLSAFAVFVKTNVIQAAYSSLGIIALFTWHKTKQLHHLYLSAVLLSMNAWTRSEGIEFIGVSMLVLGYFLYKKRLALKPFLWFILISLLPFISWQLYLGMTPELNQYAAVSITKRLFWDTDRVAQVLGAADTLLFSLNYFGLTFYILLWALIIHVFIARLKKKEYLYPLILVALIGAHLFLLYQFEYEEAGNIKTVLNHSLKRYIFNWIPVTSFVIATSLGIKWFFEKIHTFLSRTS